MKLTHENSLMLRNKITDIQKKLDELETLIDATTENVTEFDKHDFKAINKLRGWLSNLKSDIKRAGKEDIK